MALPHITKSKAGENNYDVVNTSIFEVTFTTPAALGTSQEDVSLLSEHVLKINGLGALGRAPGTSTQKFMGTERSFINPLPDSTRAEISIDLSLNLRNETDNYIYKLFRAWAALGYNMNTGERHLKKDYVAEWLQIAIGNRKGDIFHTVRFRNVMINGDIEGLDELNYETNEPLQITVKFVSDWWEETMI